MSRLEFSWSRVLSSVALLAWLMLLGAAAAASPVPVGEEAGAPVVSGMAPSSMPMTSDCMPCAICCMAPAPVTQGFSGQGHGPDAPSWRVNAPHEPRPPGSLRKGGLRACLPMRIAYCRWLD